MSAANNPDVQSPATPSRMSFRWPALAVVVGFFKVTLTLLGYGFNAGRLQTVDLSTEDIQLTPIDFLLESYQDVFAIFDFN
jgi:hypothetical protein